MYAFAYHHPSNVQDALAALANEDAKLLAGGQTLIPTMKQRLASPGSIIDLGGIAELAGISREGECDRDRRHDAPRRRRRQRGRARQRSRRSRRWRT